MRSSSQLVHGFIIGLGAIMPDAIYTATNIIESASLVQFVVADPEAISLLPVYELR